MFGRANNRVLGGQANNRVLGGQVNNRVLGGVSDQVTDPAGHLTPPQYPAAGHTRKGNVPQKCTYA